MAKAKKPPTRDETLATLDAWIEQHHRSAAMARVVKMMIDLRRAVGGVDW
jgi:hypothetical protein